MSQEKTFDHIQAVMLDFDGPICGAFAGYSAPLVAADMMAQATLMQPGLPRELAEQRDPMELLRRLHAVAPHLHEQMEGFLARAEVTSVAHATPEPGAIRVLQACHSRGWPVAVVSNNSSESVSSFISQHGLEGYIAGVYGREKSDPGLMKPHIHLLESAVRDVEVNAQSCLMVGDSITDIEVARKMGMMSVGFANKPGKKSLLKGGDIVIHSMNELADLMLS